MGAFYKGLVSEFLEIGSAELMLALTQGTAGMGFDLKPDQHVAWRSQVEILGNALRAICAHKPSAHSWGILLEYQIPGRPKRLDAVLLDGFGIIAIEFKMGATNYLSGDKWQLREYCWDLRDFHRESEGIPIAAILVATDAPAQLVEGVRGFEDKHGIILPLRMANAETF